ncbi:phenylacetic acid degradation protein PaaY [Dasania sp. GY-MA-18]|uniref:Phenylacetic acid degradation protein PaaY n=1 Tax=Dasania phycosphaerae TaxID=2950436 RepID=A0A9J6RS78_9GAMM|nr:MULTISPECIES: phenylacetic acid degradation protein PaaY [Dasania]MCR8924454.1 phenylacetic acid degradation protein PaaY [Dasania sp. GY-MA-18]MCZ0867129.1 phenylacetic acid degradation protein PaaY [Dasania phycosphaerae]MCZ0870581.1 phenylacetic acid degradation protein PaaY [Dasania phycosphaerae]
MQIYSIDGIIPVVDPSAYVHPSAVLIGDVIVGPQCYVGPNAVLRGDFGRLILERGANLQDTCVMHGFPGTDTIIEENGHIGHGAVLHGCRIGRNSLVGMNSVIMDGAVIGEECIVAACSFVKAQFLCPERSMLVGSPAKILRQVSDKEIAWKTQGTAEYQQLALRSQQSMKQVQPLSAVEPNRPRISAESVQPLYKSK